MLAKIVLDFLFPPICVICGKKTKDWILKKEENNEWICDKCSEKIIKFRKAQILKVRNINYNKYVYIFEYKHIIRKLMINFKFKSSPYISNFFSENILKDKILCRNLVNYDIIIPVPMSKYKLKQRGYNQTELISKKISKTLKITEEKILLKKDNIKTQSKLLKTGRSRNIRGAFYIIENEKIKNKKIILLDDIHTTGATVRECTKILKEAGAKDILVLVIAKD